MDVVTIDLETYYDKDYSLSKMTTEAYIRDPRFEVIGVGIKVNDYPADWYSGSEPGKFLKSLDYSRRAILCHNTFFDGAVMSWHFGIKPKIWLDTLSMARPLHGMTVGGSLANLATHYGLGKKGDEVIAAIGKRRSDFTEQELARYGSYCTNDVELTYALWKKLKPGFPPTEIAVIDQILRMFIEPEIELDVPLLEQHLAEVLERKAQLLGELDPAVLMSNVKFADALLGLDVLPPMKKSPSTGNLTYAFSKTDRGLTDLLEHPDERVQNLVAARLGTKSTLEETRTKALIGVADRGRLPIMLNYYGAHTGRCSGGDKLNLQNFPSRSGNNSLRRSLKAPPGHVLIASDSSQIEARLVAWLAQQEDLLDAFRQKRDVYSEFATKVYGRPISKANKVERFVGKVAVLSLGYGAGADKFRDMLRIQGEVLVDLNEAQRIVNLYRNENHRIAALWNKCGQALGAMYHGNSGEIRPGISYDDKGILLPSGFRIQYPMLRPSGSNTGFVYLSNPRDVKKAAAARMTGQDDSGAWTKIYGGKVTENCIAAGTEVLTDRGWIPIEKVQLVDKVHDGVEFVCHGGTVFKSVQNCVAIDGVWMTPDHEVLTNDGWQAASQNPEPYRPDLRHIDCDQSRAQRWEETVLAVPLPVRNAMREGRIGGSQGGQAGRDSELRVYDQTTDCQGEQYTWDVQAPGVRRVAQYGGSLSASVASIVAQLRRSWYHGMRTVAASVRELLAGHGTNIPAWVGPQSQGQRRSVQSRELRVDYPSSQHHEQAHYRAQSGCVAPQRTDRDTEVNAVLPTQTWPVFDILNAGPRQRFVVRGDTGPFIVHNCVQGLAAYFIRQCMAQCRLRHIKVVFQVHDELIIIAPEELAERYTTTLEMIMTTPPSWAPDLPLACESGMAVNYGDT